jgi:hypothetical protein
MKNKMKVMTCPQQKTTNHHKGMAAVYHPERNLRWELFNIRPLTDQKV